MRCTQLAFADGSPVYIKPPVITAVAFSKDGLSIAVSGYKEALIHDVSTGSLTRRVPSTSQKLLSLIYSQDGKILVGSGGTPAVSGELQIWDTADYKLINSVKIGTDTLFGAALSADATRLVFGGSDNTVRIITVPEGKQILKFDNHSDWVLATVFTFDNNSFLSTGRDSAIKLVHIEGETGSFIDDINTHTTIMRTLVRHPKLDQVLCGGDDGVPRLYKVYRTEARSMNQEDHNLIKAYDGLDSLISALAFQPEGKLFAAGTEAGNIALFETETGRKLGELTGAKGAIYCIAFSSDGKTLAAGGMDGMLRIYEVSTRKLLREFVPVPLSKPVKEARH